jgi:hypothetical protein
MMFVGMLYVTALAWALLSLSARLNYKFLDRLTLG